MKKNILITFALFSQFTLLSCERSFLYKNHNDNITKSNFDYSYESMLNDKINPTGATKNFQYAWNEKNAPISESNSELIYDKVFKIINENKEECLIPRTATLKKQLKKYKVERFGDIPVLRVQFKTNKIFDVYNNVVDVNDRLIMVIIYPNTVNSTIPLNAEMGIIPTYDCPGPLSYITYKDISHDFESYKLYMSKILYYYSAFAFLNLPESFNYKDIISLSYEYDETNQILTINFVIEKIIKNNSETFESLTSSLKFLMDRQAIDREISNETVRVNDMYGDGLYYKDEEEKINKNLGLPVNYWNYIGYPYNVKKNFVPFASNLVEKKFIKAEDSIITYKVRFDKKFIPKRSIYDVDCIEPTTPDDYFFVEISGYKTTPVEKTIIIKEGEIKDNSYKNKIIFWSILGTSIAILIVVLISLVITREVKKKKIKLVLNSQKKINSNLKLEHKKNEKIEKSKTQECIKNNFPKK